MIFDPTVQKTLAGHDREESLFPSSSGKRGYTFDFVADN
jgi:hypothetical protein